MDLEQLKLVLETIQSMGGDAKEFGVWWLVCSTIPNVLLFIFGIIVTWAFVKMICHVANLVNASWRVAETLGVYVHGGWKPSDTKEVIQKIRKLKEGA